MSYSCSFRVLLTYFHIECQREKEAKDADKFNEIYLPDQTDIETKLPFIKKGTKEVEISLGNIFTLLYNHISGDNPFRT